MRATFLNLVDLLGCDALLREETLRAAGCQNLEACFHQNADRRQNAFLVLIADRDEHRAGARQVDASTQLRLGECQREIGVETDDFAG